MQDDFPSPQQSMNWKWRLLLSAALFGPAIYFGINGDSVAAFVIAVTAFSAFFGYRAGAVSIGGFLIAFAAAVTSAPRLGLAYEDRFADWFGTSGLANRALAIGSIGVVVSLVVSTFVIYLGNRILRRRSRLSALNRWAGFLIGAAEGIVVCFFFLGGMLIMEPTERRKAPRRDPNDRRGQLISKLVVETAARTRSSKLGPIITQYNPFTLFPSLNRMDDIQNSVEVLSDPNRVSDFLEHPSIQELKATPEVREAVDQLTQDPGVQQFLDQERPMDMEVAKTLLNHPALLELIDHPGFLEQAAEAIQRTEILGPSQSPGH